MQPVRVKFHKDGVVIVSKCMIDAKGHGCAEYLCLYFSTCCCITNCQHVGCIQVLAQAEKVVARLTRLDEIMPKYQHVASQLYDLLRVRGLDEVVPAVKALVS